MKAVLTALLLIPCATAAEEVRSLAKSPDGKFELMLRASTPDDYGWVAIKNTSTGAIIDTETGQGYSNFRTHDVDAFWKGDSSVFAVSVCGTKTTRSTDVYFRDGEAWEKLVLPPYISNILGRQGVVATGRNIYEDFGGFEGDSQFTIICHVEPDWQQKEAAEKFLGWKPTNQTDWKVLLEIHKGTLPNCGIVSIEPHNDSSSNEALDSTSPPISSPAK